MNERVHVTVDASRGCGTLPHTWNYIGYDECNYTHSPGGMALLEKFGQMEKPYYVRMHHMLCTGNMHAFYKWGSTNVYTEDEAGRPVYSFDLIDEMMDILLRSRCKPFFELGFMPRDLADPREARNGKSYQIASVNSEYQQVGWAMPPKDYRKWYGLIFALMTHLKNRYGAEEMNTWYFEMWNEPDILYWRGTKDEYCKLYDYTEAAVHAVLPTARFGGPATCGTREKDGGASQYLRYFLNHIRNGKNHVTGQTGTRIDFTSFHTKGGGYNFDALAKKQLPSVQTFLANVQTQAGIIQEFGFGRLECVLSEADPDGWAAGGRFDNFNLNFRNTEYYASYVMSAYKNLYDLAEKMRMDIRPLAWAFQFEAERCFEGTRAFSTQGICKAVFNLFRLLSRMGRQRVALSSSRDLDPLAFADLNGTSEGPEVDGWAALDSEDRIQVLLYCHHDDWDRKETFDVEMRLLHLPMEGSVQVRHLRIDENHSNAYAEWVRQGKPNYPSEGQREAILARSSLEYLDPPAIRTVREGTLHLSFPLPTHGISLLEIVKI